MYNFQTNTAIKNFQEVEIWGDIWQLSLEGSNTGWSYRTRKIEKAERTERTDRTDTPNRTHRTHPTQRIHRTDRIRI